MIMNQILWNITAKMVACSKWTIFSLLFSVHLISVYTTSSGVMVYKLG